MNPDQAMVMVEDVAEILSVEQAVIGCVLVEGASVRLPPLGASEFALDRHRILWQAILDLAEQSEPVDGVTVEHALRRAGTWDAAGGAPMLDFLTTAPLAAAIPAHLMAYAQRVRDAARARSLRALGMELANRGMPQDDIEQRLREAPGCILPSVYDPAIIWQRVVEAYRTKRLKTGWVDVDRIALGLQPSDFLVIGARTSHGKTAFIVNLARRFAAQGVTVDVVALEENQEQMLRRFVAASTGITTSLIRDGILGDEEFRECEDAVRGLQPLPLRVMDLSHLRSLHEEPVLAAVGASSAAVVIVDHLQKIQTRGESRVYGLERVLNGLHAVALRDRRIVIVTAQLNRDAEARKGAPQMSDIRDCGGVEILARMVWLLSWPSKYDSTRSPSDYEVHVAKQGESGTGVARLFFDARCGRFLGQEGA